jgi:hypothetical protein
LLDANDEADEADADEERRRLEEARREVWTVSLGRIGGLHWDCYKNKILISKI